jgi:hypothetical protein
MQSIINNIKLLQKKKKEKPVTARPRIIKAACKHLLLLLG